MRTSCFSALWAFGLTLTLPISAQADVRVTMKDGLVTLTANGATVREILAEWARVGQTRIVNAERVAGAPLTLELSDMPEAQALDIVLRSVSGYLAAPRTEMSPGLSRYDRILVLPTSAPPRNTAPPPRNAATPAPAPAFTPPPFQQPDEDDEDPAERPVPAGVPSPGNAVFSTFPQPGVVPMPPNAPAGEQPAAPPPGFGGSGGRPFGQTPAGVTVPGMVVPTPTQSGQYPPTQPPDQNQR